MELNIWEKAMGWRKRQMVSAQLNNEVYEKIRNDTLEEVAREIEKMKAFGPDTIGSFTVVIRDMKR
jgi:predicted transcriptional regulator